MYNRTVFTTFTPLPPSISREEALAFLHDHIRMIELNPLIVEHNRISPPEHALPEELAHIWYSIVETVTYMFGFIKWNTSFTCSFHDLPDGLLTHPYAPLAIDVQNKWSVGGSLAGEPKEPTEQDIGAPSKGLYLREDVNMGCSFLMAGWIQQTMKKSHTALVEHFAGKGQAGCRIDPVGWSYLLSTLTHSAERDLTP